MPQFKATFFFSQGRYGWSETYYRTDANIEEALEQANLLRPARVALLGHATENGDSPYLLAIRVSDVAIQRDSLLWSAGAGLTGSWGLPSEYEADHPELALMVRAESGANYRRTLWLHGIPDKLWRNESYNADALWLARFAQFQSKILQAQWAIRVINKLNPPIRVTDISRPTPGGPIRIVSDLAIAFLSGSTVRLSGVRNAKQLNREWPMISISATQLDLVGSNSLALPVPYLGGATVKKQEIIYAPIDKLIIREIRTRECGVPFGSPVGRRHTRTLVAL